MADFEPVYDLNGKPADRPMYYILNEDKTIGHTNDVMVWGRNREAHKRVSQDNVGGYWISTVFIGLDHSFGLYGPPLIFETMVFKGGTDKSLGDDIHCERYSTYAEAEAGHKRVVEAVKAGEIT